MVLGAWTGARLPEVPLRPSHGVHGTPSATPCQRSANSGHIIYMQVRAHHNFYQPCELDSFSTVCQPGAMLEVQERQVLAHKITLRRQLPSPEVRRAVREMAGVTTSDVAE